MMDGGQRGNLMGSNNTQNKILVMVCINLANLVCHSVYSVLAAFFPQEGKAKGMSDDTVGVIFAAFAAVSIVCSPFVGRLMSMHGKVWIYILGLLLVSVSTISFSVASLLPAGAPFAAWCLAMRILQGLGAALEETAAYAIIADIDSENVSFFLGITEISTGLGYMVGPPVGGLLFSFGGFAMPFLLHGTALLPAAALIYLRVPSDAHRAGKEDADARDIPMSKLVASPQVMVIAIASMLANSDYAFLEPTLGDHSTYHNLASSPRTVGMLFSVASVVYTLSCPLIGMLANRSRFGPRPIIVSGMLAQLLGFLLIGPSPLLRPLGVGESLGMGQMVLALVLFGLGESMSMTPVMDDMMHSCGESADAAVNSLSSLMAASFSLGQMVGPIVGAGLTTRIGFPWACTLMALVLLLHTTAIVAVDLWRPRARIVGGGYTELTAVNVPTAETAA
jgi:MFS family permease